jgi:hypothetical protein
MFVNPNYAKLCTKLYCEKCNYGTSRKSSFDNHLLSAKHIKSTFVNPNYAKKCKIFACQICEKTYKDKSGLWRHKNKCKVEMQSKSESDEPSDKEIIMMLIKDNSEFKNIMMKVLENGTHNTTNNNNSHNKSFNLQFFLNETCKNAMNITDFVDSLQFQLSDLENVGELGYIEGISNIIIKNLNALDVTDRPIHCTDKKRETMYIKDKDKWEKEDDNKTKLHKMVRRVSNKNIDLISDFKLLHPEWKKSTSKVSDKFNSIIIESMGGDGDNDYEKEEKIIKRVTKEVFIDKCL